MHTNNYTKNCTIVQFMMCTAFEKENLYILHISFGRAVVVRIIISIWAAGAIYKH